MHWHCCLFIYCLLTIVTSTVLSFSSPISSIVTRSTSKYPRSGYSQTHQKLDVQSHHFRVTTTKSTTHLQAIPSNMALRAVTASTAASTTICLLCIAMAVTWKAAYNRGKRQGRSELLTDDAPSCSSSNKESESVSKPKHSKQYKQNNSSTTPIDKDNNNNSLRISPIGTVSSIYRLCVGTPRQGMLVKHSRGIITFDETLISKDSILELEKYSHVYVVFVFHLNNNTNKIKSSNNNSNGSNDGSSSSSGGSTKNNNNQRQFKGKISPPSLGGKKVGIFSTRTPHRPNPIGFSLCKLDGIVHHNKKSKKNSKAGKDGVKNTFSLLLSGLDLVDGTPILDVKPYVPHYDCVGYNADNVMQSSSSSTSASTPSTVTNNNESDDTDVVRVPDWVDSGLQKRRKVTFLREADQFLQDLASSNTTLSSSSSSSITQLQFYGPNSPWLDTPHQTIQNVKHCIYELLSVDVRSAWQTKKARMGKFQAERSSRVKEWSGKDDDIATIKNASGGDESSKEDRESMMCTQQIDNLLVQYTIEEPGSALYQESTVNSDNKGSSIVDERSMGSGAEDILVVHSISFIK